MSPSRPDNFDVLCAGSIVQDTIVRPVDNLRWGTTTFVESMDRFVGGNGANTASALRVLGNRVRLLGTLGSDDAAQFVRAELERLGIDTCAIATSAQPNAATTVLVNSAGDRQFLHRLGSSGDAFREPLGFTESLVAGARHFHMASFFVLPHLRRRAPEILRGARACGLSTSVDVNWDPHNEWL
ncbi:MAG TPA: PfkB family carbohydrate kinase, partial [Acidobacteriaceae bacterium]|nr:PfkB family carbohydrate kinase [Acidobacteriaceae bacterium]